jgi:hypothetical protein
MNGDSQKKQFSTFFQESFLARTIIESSPFPSIYS